MTPSDFQAYRAVLGLSQPTLARLLGISGAHAVRTVRRYELGERGISFEVAYLLEWLATDCRPVTPPGDGPATVLVRWLVTGDRPVA